MGNGDQTEVGFSTQWSQIHNSSTGDDGSHYALGVHMNGDYGPYNVMLQAMRYEYSMENPDGTTNDYIYMGAYDFPYRVAPKGYMLTAGVSKDIAVDWGSIDKITVYNDYGVLLKDNDDFHTSQQNVLGCAFTVGRVTTYVDLAFGQNHAWVGPGWTNSFAAGDGNAWHTRFNVNVGYYF